MQNKNRILVQHRRNLNTQTKLVHDNIKMEDKQNLNLKTP